MGYLEFVVKLLKSLMKYEISVKLRIDSFDDRG